MSADLEPEGSAIVSHPTRALQGLSQLAASPDPPLQAIRLILSSYTFNQTGEKRARETDLDRRSKKPRGHQRSRWPCKICSHSYSANSSLQRHIKTAHATKRRLVVTAVFECDDCEYSCASQQALDTHMDTHASSSAESKSPKYKCAFCHKERTGIYQHYGSHHKIDYPEQILFDNGNVLVRSGINSDNGRAPWFLREKEKMALYDNVTCRLCETVTRFDNPQILADHYTMYHMVEPTMTDNLRRLFRAEKGAHLIGSVTSHTPKGRTDAIIKQKVCNPKEKPEKSKVNLKPRAKQSILRVVFDCKQCDQVYPTEELLGKHKKEKHGSKSVEKAKTVKYKCTFCRKDVAQIYKHYGNVHKIEYPEQILFDNGNVLVLTNINTEGGQAPWFLNEKEKSESRYTPKTCRLCETEYDTTDLLGMHYLTGHKVDLEVLHSLNNLRCLFRAEKGAHLADLPASRATKRQQRISCQSRPVNQTERKNNEVIVHAEEDAPGLIMYQCAECGVAAPTCDASVEHAQLHHLAEYTPVSLPCDICSFAFEAQCFADHSSIHHLDRNEYKIVKFHPSKLHDEWSEMFEGLSESHANRIKASSTYQYTRKVKMNSDVVAGIPLYQCGKCQLYVRPKDVEGHCYGKNSCVDNQSHGYDSYVCPDCDVEFNTCAGLTDHEKEHKKYGDDCFRKVTFNCGEDEILNQALQKLQSTAVKETPKTINNMQPIVILEDIPVKRFCNECKKSIWNAEFEAHAAMHKVNDNAIEQESNQRPDRSPGKQNSLSNKDHKETREVAPQNMALDTEKGLEGTVEQWDSDNDSCPSQQVLSCTVNVDVHEQNEMVDVRQSNQVGMTSKNGIGSTDVQNADSEVDLSFLHDIDFEEMAKELKNEIQQLGFKELGIHMNKWAYIPDLSLLDAFEDGEKYSMCSNKNISQDIII